MITVPETGSSEEAKRMFALALAAQATAAEFRTNMNTVAVATSITAEGVVRRAKLYMDFIEGKDKQ